MRATDLRRRPARLALLLAVMLLVSTAGPAAAGAASTAREARVMINGQELDGLRAVMVEQRVLVPLRGVFERLGAEVSYDGDTRTIDVSRANVSVRLRVGETVAVRAGRELVVDPAPMFIGQQVYVPVRFVTETLGDRVAWDAERDAVVIESAYARRLEQAGLLPPRTTVAASAAGEEEPRQPRVPFDEADVDLMARLVSAEAWGEPFEGMVAVAAVVINRVLSPRFPDTIRDVIMQRGQFTPVWNGTIHRNPHPRAREAVMAALYGEDPTGGALYFYNPRHGVPSFLRGRPVTQIGNHAFAR